MADLTEQPWREWDREALWRKLQEAERRVVELDAECESLAGLASTDEVANENGRLERERDEALARVAELEGAAIADQMALDEKRELLANLHGLTADAALWADLILQRDEARARVAELEPGGWQPIANKPQDGDLVVVYLRKTECYDLVYWSESSSLWMQDEVSGWRDDQLAAWVALPLPPSPSVAEAPAGAESAGGEA